jgi:hypothetical protein
VIRRNECPALKWYLLSKEEIFCKRMRIKVGEKKNYLSQGNNSCHNFLSYDWRFNKSLSSLRKKTFLLEEENLLHRKNISQIGLIFDSYNKTKCFFHEHNSCERKLIRV